MILIYNSILLLFFIPVSIYFLIKSIKDPAKGVFLGWAERLGAWSFPEMPANKEVLWFHGASVGEVRSLEPLIREFKNYTTVLSVLTPSGLLYARKNKSADFVYLAPLDLTPVVRKVISKVRPKALILFETEIWPGLIFEARKAKIITMLVNGRLSTRSFPIYMALQKYWKQTLNRISFLCARTEEDADNFKALGYSGQIAVTGNVKYDRNFSVPEFSRSKIGLSDSDSILVAGSTRESEEEILVEAFLEAKKRFPGLKLVIAPRHLSRTDSVIRLLKKLSVSTAVYSKGVSGSFDCLVVDTFGDLMKFYSIADITFVGGSLVNKGGQNPIEPASCSKAVLFGPHMQNFKSEARILAESGGGFKVEDSSDLALKISELLSDRMRLIDAGKKAFGAMIAQKGALKRTIEVVQDALK